MPRNTYFDQYETETEQSVLDDLNVEAIEIFGVEMYYLPRIQITPDEIYTESPIAEFRNAYALPVYIESYAGFQGDGNFLSKFGVEIRDQLEFTIAMRTFEDEVAALETDVELIRPREGDLIYYPHRKATFQIMFVDKRAVFYPLGSLHTYKMTVELFEYSGERFQTGVAEIDSLEQKYTNDLLLWAIHNEDGDYWINEDSDILVREQYANTSPEPWVDNEYIQDEGNTHIIQDEGDPFSWGKI